MKKFSKVLVAALAAAMILGSSLTAFAAPSTATTSATVADATGVTATTAAGVEVKVEAATAAKVTEAAAAAQQIFGETLKNVVVEKCFELKATITAPTDITIAVPGVKAGQQVTVLHQMSNGAWESVAVKEVKNGSVTATFTSLSPVAILTYGSPKTAQALPVAGLVAIIALCGAAVCVKKLA